MNTKKISLTGKWEIIIDGINGINELNGINASGEIEIPGTLQSQGYGNDITTKTPWVEGLHDRLWHLRKEYKYAQENGTQIPFSCQPKKHYIGWATYRKNFFVTKENAKKHAEFYIEKTSWATNVIIDGKDIGKVSGLCVPHVHSLGRLEEGEHTIEVIIDNSMRYAYRPEAHSISDSLAATWNGMVGEVFIEFLSEVKIKNLKIYPNIKTKTARAELLIKSSEEKEIKIVCNQNQEFKFDLQKCENKIELIINYPKDCELWDEYNPKLYSLEICLKYDNEEVTVKEQFGFRKIEAKDGKFLLNEKPIYFRGNHYGGGYPLTGYPDTSKEYWRKVISVLKNWGMNCIRFHSYCPTKEAFNAADEMGFYFLAETGMWNVFNKDDEMTKVLDSETKKILDTFGNHASFILFSPSNEPNDQKGEWLEPLAEWVKKWRAIDDRHLYTMQSGWPYPMPPNEIDGNDYIYFHRSGFGLEPGGTIRNSPGWREKDYRESLTGIKYPVISHELGQWCAYPDFEIINKFTGFLKPSSYEIFRENAKANNVYDFNKEFVYNSGRLQYTLYKEDIEANFRTPHIYGYEMLDLRDYFGQGTALVGMIDPFWDDKGYVSADEFKKINNETVLLIRIKKRTFEIGEEIKTSLEIAHFGKGELTDCVVYIKIIDENGNEYANEKCEMKKIPLAKNIFCMENVFKTENFETPKAYKIIAGIENTQIQNDWNIWVYPKKFEISEKTENVFYTRDWTDAKDALTKGKNVLFSPTDTQLSYKCPPLSFKSVFWNAHMGPTYRRSLGLVCDEKHAALKDFPTNSYADWQWEEIMNNATGINLETLPKNFPCIVRAIDDWNRNYSLGLIFEGCAGSGKLIIAATDFEKSLSCRQLKNSLIKYMDSDLFAPKEKINIKDLEKIFFRRDTMQVLNAVAHLEEDKNFSLDNIFDGDGESGIVGNNLNSLNFPYHIHIKWDKKIKVQGFVYLPRQNHRCLEGAIFEYELYTKSAENETLTKILDGEFESTFEEQKVIFENEIEADNLILVLKSPFSDEDVTQWYVECDGWKQKKGRYADTCFSMNAFSIITNEDLGKVKYVSKDKKAAAKSVTGDIEN